MAEENAIEKTQPAQIQVEKGALQLGTLADLWRTAKMFVQSELCPSGLNTESKVVVALQAGAELGFKPWQSLQSLHVINGRVGLEGFAMLALIRKNHSCEYISCSFEGKPYENDFKAVVKSKRRDEAMENVTDFSVDDAIRADLWNGGSRKKDNWIKYPKDMLTWRAVSRHARRYYSDLISGMYSTDELETIEAQPLAQTFENAPEDSPKSGTSGLLNRMKQETAAVTPPKHVESKQEDVAPLEKTEEELLAEADKKAKAKKKGRPAGAKNKKKAEAPEPAMSIDEVQEAPMPADVIPEQAPEEEPAPVEKPEDKLLDEEKEKDFTCKGCNHSFNKDDAIAATGGKLLCDVCFKVVN